jgi:PhnB protein
MDEAPPAPGQSQLSPEADKRLVVHVEFPIVGGHAVMGTDASESMGFALAAGKNVCLNLKTDTRE